MSTLETIGLITGIITILGAVVGVTRYVTQLQYRVGQERLQSEAEHSQQRISDLEARNRDLLNDMALARRVGTAALSRKLEVDEALEAVMGRMRARAGSVYIPLPAEDGGEPRGLVFLSIQPLGQQAAALKKKIIPLQSSAGRCFRSGQPYASPNPQADPAHYRKADQVSGYSTESMLNVPLRHRNETIGVLQLLNKEGPAGFGDQDLPLVEPFVGSLAARVAEFVRAPENLEILGFAQERAAEQATVMFCDITRSSLLFQEMSVASAVQHINEYFEGICDVGLSYGATVDKYIGDGVLLRFNVPRRVDDHPMKAVRAALEMRAVFQKMKGDWMTMGEPLGPLFTRIGIAFGEVHEAAIGHPQYQYLTILGQPVNVAVNLCDAAARDRDVIVIGEGLYKQVGSRLLVEPLPKERLGKAVAYIDSAYELLGVR
jgi:class 3 adenylate cyclase